MWSALRARASYYATPSINHHLRNLESSYAFSILSRPLASSALSSMDSSIAENNKDLLSLSEVEKILSDVGADDVKVIQAPSRCEFTDYMVIATGRSPWHVRNISQALIYKAVGNALQSNEASAKLFRVKQKQRGAKRMLLPTVVGQEGGKWIVIDSGKLIVHAVDEKARAYYNFEGLWTNTSNTEHIQDLEQALVKVRRKNNSKKRPQTRS